MRQWIAATVLALVGCSSPAPGSGPCQQRHGTFSTRFVERDGTCGALSEQIATVDAQPVDVPAPCTGSIRYSADNCQVTYSTICPRSGKPGHLTSDGKATWNVAGTAGSSVEQWSISREDGSIECSSTYNVTVTRM